MSDQYKRDDCYFCDEDDEGILQTHHIVPQRFEGPDTESNLVTVCPTCHRKIESLYDKRFYDFFQRPVEDERKVLAQRLIDIATICPWCELSTIPDRKNQCIRCDGDLESEPNESDLRERWSERKGTVYDIIEYYEYESSEVGAPIDRVIERAIESTIDQDEAERFIEEFRNCGDVYEPQKGYLRGTLE